MTQRPHRLASALLKPALFVFFAAFAAACSAGSAPNYTLGQQYNLVAQPQAPADPKKIEIEEFFCYCCPHCFHADPSIEEWRKHLPADVSFKRVPNSLGRDDGKILEQAFYIGQALGVGDKVHRPLFEAIHVHQQYITSLDQVKQIFADAAGVKPADFDGTAGSFVVDTGVRQADNESITYQIQSVPSIVVGGKYVVVGAPDDLLKIVDFLVDKVRKERKA
ncbi:MAG: thiol:disulfide interchange protein DsbA/DsbL [Nevskia sp.]|nr:thiol:disulfide interchange protein DsbA/DsbL [Nevskia sp.]